MLAEAWRNSVGSNCTALPTLLGPRTRITHALQSVMGCILSTMHCRSQHCWTDSVGSCCVRVGSGVETDATTPNIVGPIMLRVIVSVARSFRPTMHSVGQRRNCCNRLPLDNRLEFLNHICLWGFASDTAVETWAIWGNLREFFAHFLDGETDAWKG